MGNASHEEMPVRIYQTKDQVFLAAPMPGLEPDDISVTIDGKRVTVRGDRRGSDNDWREVLVSEWTVGPYHREVNLHIAVNGSHSNATFGNGVLVLSMPKARDGGVPKADEFSLQVTEAPRGERVRHTGHDLRKTTTQEHLRLRAETIRKSAPKNS